MRSLTLLLVLSLAFAGGLLRPTTAHAKERSSPIHFGLGVTAFALTVPYGAVKTGYAVGASVIGALAWVFSGGRDDVARAIIQPGIRGDYVVMPEHLVNERPLIFSGRDSSSY